MADPSINGGYGALAFPLALTGTTSHAEQLDPGQAAIGGLLKAAINAELGAAWQAICNRLEPGHHLNRVPGRLPVADVTDMEPSPAVLGQKYATWPILAVYREGEPRREPLNLVQRKTIQRWAVDYVIGPLDAGDQARVGKFAQVVGSVINRVIEEGWHPAYQSGRRQFHGQFMRIDVVGQMGPGVARVLGDEKGNGYYGLSILLQTEERTARTVGHASDIANKYYPAFAAAPAGTATTGIQIAESYNNKTPDPE